MTRPVPRRIDRRSRFPRALPAAAAALALTFGCGGAESPDEPSAWSGAAILQADLGDTVNQDSQVAAAADGRVWAVWTHASGSVWTSESRDGTTWSAPARLDGSGFGLFAAHLVLRMDPAGNGFAAWLAFDSTGQARVRVARHTTSAGWAPQQELEAGRPSDITVLSLEVESAGTAILAWGGRSGARLSIFDGGAWSVPQVVVPSSPLDVSDLAVRLRGRAAAMVWGAHDERASPAEAHTFARYLDLLQGASAEQDLGPSGFLGGRVAIDANGVATFLWGAFVPGATAQREVQATRFDPLRGWSGPVPLGSATSIVALEPDVGDRLVALLLAPGASGEAAVVTRRFGSDTGWTQASQVVTGGRSIPDEVGFAPAVQRIGVVATDRGGVAVGRPAGGDWALEQVPRDGVPAMPPACPGGGVPYVFSPRVAIDAQGAVTTTWLQWDCSRTSLFARHRMGGAS